MSDEAPAWMRAYVAHCVPLLGLQAWEITTRVADHVDCKDSSTIGETWLKARYWLAKITMQRDTQPTDAGFLDLTHELLHIALAGQDVAARQIIDLVPEGQQDHALRLWADGDEPVTEALARALTPLLRASFVMPGERTKKGKRK